MPGISGGLTANRPAPRRGHLAVDDDPLGPSPRASRHPVAGSRRLAATRRKDVATHHPLVKLRVVYKGKDALISLLKPLRVKEFEQLVFAALQAEYTGHVMGLETTGGVVVPVSLLCQNPAALCAYGPGPFHLLVSSTSKRPIPAQGAGARVVSSSGGGLSTLSHDERVLKIMEFARILQRHDYLTGANVSRVHKALSVHQHLTWVICLVYSAEPDAEQLLRILKTLGNSSDASIQKLQDTVKVTELVATGAEFTEPMLINLYFLALINHDSVTKAFEEFCSSSDQRAFKDHLSTANDQCLFRRACLRVLTQLFEAGYLTEQDGQTIATHLVQAGGPDPFVLAAFELFEDEGDLDELLDTLRHTAQDIRRRVYQDDEADWKETVTTTPGSPVSANECDEAFEAVLERLVARGRLHPVESAWLLGRRAAQDPTLDPVYRALKQGDGPKSAALQVIRLAKFWHDYLSEHDLHLERIVELVRGDLLTNQETDQLLKLVEESNNMVVSAFEAFAFNLNLEELHETLKIIAATYLGEEEEPAQVAAGEFHEHNGSIVLDQDVDLGPLDDGLDEAHADACWKMSNYMQRFDSNDYKEFGDPSEQQGNVNREKDYAAENAILGHLVDAYRSENNGSDPTDEHLQRWIASIREHNLVEQITREEDHNFAEHDHDADAQANADVADSRPQRVDSTDSDREDEEAFLDAAWKKELLRMERDDEVAHPDDERDTDDIPEDEQQYFDDTLQYLVEEKGLSLAKADAVRWMFTTGDDNMRAAFKVHEITEDDGDLIETLLIIFEEAASHTISEGRKDKMDLQDTMTATLSEVTMSMVHQYEVTMQEGVALRRLLSSNHDRILQIWENYSEDRNLEKLKDALRDIARKVDTIYNVSETSSSADEFDGEEDIEEVAVDNEDDDDEDDDDDDDEDDDEAEDEDHDNIFQGEFEDEVDEAEEEDEDVKGLPVVAPGHEEAHTLEASEEDEALDDAYHAMEPEEVVFLRALRRQHPLSHFTEVMSAAAKVFTLDRDIESFVETLRLVVSQAVEVLGTRRDDGNAATPEAAADAATAVMCMEQEISENTLDAGHGEDEDDDGEYYMVPSQLEQ